MPNEKKVVNTPKEMYPFIKKYAKGKIFCDLGSGRGKLLDAMKGIAKELIGIENNKDVEPENEDFQKSLLKHNIIQGDFTINLPDADVYYFWGGDPRGRYNSIKDMAKGKIVLLGAHSGTREPKFVLKECDESITQNISVGNGVFSIGVFHP